MKTAEVSKIKANATNNKKNGRHHYNYNKKLIKAKLFLRL